MISCLTRKTGKQGRSFGTEMQKEYFFFPEKAANSSLYPCIFFNQLLFKQYAKKCFNLYSERMFVVE